MQNDIRTEIALAPFVAMDPHLVRHPEWAHTYFDHSRQLSLHIGSRPDESDPRLFKHVNWCDLTVGVMHEPGLGLEFGPPYEESQRQARVGNPKGPMLLAEVSGGCKIFGNHFIAEIYAVRTAGLTVEMRDVWHQNPNYLLEDYSVDVQELIKDRFAFLNYVSACYFDRTLAQNARYARQRHAFDKASLIWRKGFSDNVSPNQSWPFMDHMKSDIPLERFLNDGSFVFGSLAMR